MRDYALGTTFDIKFTTRRFSTGAPFTLAGSPVVSAYVGNDLTQITAGITLSVDFDGVTGLNNVRVVATGGNGYATASNYALVITTGTVDSVSVVGEVVGEFSLEAQSFLRPTTAGMTLDVSSGGEAGLDWANIGSPTTSVNLSGTIIGTLSALAANTITASSIAANAITEAKIADAAIDAATFAANAITATVIADGAIDAATFAASAINANALATDAVTEIADGLLNRDMSAVSDTTARSPLNALRFLRNKFETVSNGTVLKVYEEDDTTLAWQSNLTVVACDDVITGSDPG